ncbi:MAG: aromatic ring-hydroxylating dioxygenase subunit alpha [Pseudomonadota bacterium]
MTVATQSFTEVTDASDFQDMLNASQLPVDEAMSLPAACYHDESVQKSESKKIFHRHWLGLGRADRFKEPGQFETMDIAGVPLLLISDRNGVLHAFNNACRHRGAKLLSGEGNTKVISCPFHCWTYHANGQFITAPHMSDSKNFDKSTLGLVEFALKIHAGFVFVCFDPDPPDFSQFLGDFDRLHSPWPLETLVSVRRQSFEVKCNWKLFLDVFNEYYHLQFVHPDSINGVYAKPDPADVTSGAYASQFGATEGTGGLLESQQAFALPAIPGLQGQAKNGTRYTWVYPNMTFAAGTDSLWIYEAYPLDPQRCIAYQTLCFPQEALDLDDFETKVAFYYERFDAAVEEDRIALENQQQGLASPFSKPGPYSPSMEPNVAAFARWYAQRMQAK